MKKIRRSMFEIAKDIDKNNKKKPTKKQIKKLFDSLEKCGLTEKK